MGTLSTAYKNAAVDGGNALVGYAALLDSAGVELTGGSPAYARKAIAYNAAANGEATITGPVVFDVPAGGEVAKAALFADLEGGTALGIDDLPAIETYTGQGTYTLTGATISTSDPA